MHRLSKAVINLAWVFVLIFAELIFLRLLVLGVFNVPSGAMETTIFSNDTVVTFQLAYGLRIPITDRFILRYSTPQRGQIVVFIPPHERSKVFLKRCVGLPGDIIQMKEKKFYINDVLQEEPFVVHKDPYTYRKGVTYRLDPDVATQGPIYEKGCNRDNFGPNTVPPDHIFCLGDNRDNSNDSRFWGPVPIDDVLVKAIMTVWPPQHWRTF